LSEFKKSDDGHGPKKGDYVRQSLVVLNQTTDGCYRTNYLREFIAN